MRRWNPYRLIAVFFLALFFIAPHTLAQITPGPIYPNGSAGLSFVTSLPATCTPGITASVQLSVAPYTVNYCSATNTWTALGAGGGSGTVTSVGLTLPSWLTNSTPTITSSGIFAVTPTAAQTSHQVIGTCGSGTTFAPCVLAASDLPTAIPIANIGTTGLTGTLPISISAAGAISTNPTSHNVSVPLVCAAASGSGTAYTCSTSPSFTPADGDVILFQADVANTGAATLNVNATAAAPLRRLGGTTALEAGYLAIGSDCLAEYDGANWQLQCADGNALSGGTVTSVTGTANQIAVATGTTTPVVSIATPFIFPSGNVTGNTGTYDFTATTLFKGRVSAGLTTSANGDHGEDSTNFFWHGYGNGVDSFFPTYGSVSSLSPTYDLVANGGCDPTGVVAADTCFANALAYFNGAKGGTITWCGTFKLAAPPVVVTNPVSFVNSCGGQSGGNDYTGTADRGGAVLTSTANVNVTNPTTAPGITGSTSGGSLATGTTFWVEATCVNGFGETLPSPAASYTTTTSASSIAITSFPYVSGCFAYNIYIGTGGSQPANGAMWLNATANFLAGSGTYAGPPFLNMFAKANPTIISNSTTGTNPPASNTATHGGVLMQLGSPTSDQNNAYLLNGIYFYDSTGVLGAGLANVSSTRSQLMHLGFEGFNAVGALAGNAPYENGGIGYVEGFSRGVNYTEIWAPYFRNNTLSSLMGASDTAVYGGNCSNVGTQLCIDYPSGNLRMYGIHLNSASAGTPIGGIVSRGTNAGSQFGGMFYIKAEGFGNSTGPVMKMVFSRGVIYDCWCVSTQGSPTAANAAVTFDANSSGNIVRITQGAPKIVPFSDGTTSYNDPSSGNLIEASIDGIFQTGNGITTEGIVQATTGTKTISGADYTNSTVTPSTVFSWTLPATAVAKNYRFTCDIMWESTNTTLVGPVFGVNISAAPTQLTASASVQNTLAGADINGYLSNATTGSQTLVTSAAAGVTSTNYWAKIWGTIESAPTAGSTFIINAASTSGTTATLNIRRGSGCTLN